VTAARDLPATAAAVALAAVLAGTALVVDSSAAAAFDAPKRLLAFVGLVFAAATLLAGGGMRTAWPEDRGARTVLAALGVALAGACVATLFAPRAAVARAGLHGLVVLGLALPLGASRACEGPRRNALLAVFLGAVAIDALVSILQSAGLELFAGATVAGRADTGALVGNEGHLAQLVAFAGIVAAILAWRVARADVRIVAGSVFVVFAAALVVNRNVTALGTLATGIAIALVLLEGRRALVPLAAVVVLMAVVVAAAAPLRTRVAAAVAAARAGDWDAVTTWRLGAWSAAAGMIRERPLVGHGPGTFGAEFMQHRLEAEIRQRRRLVVPILTSNFGEAHSEYLQAAAEAGIPATLALLVAAGALLARLSRVARDSTDPRRDEAATIAALLGAAAVASLTWFPWQRPVTAVPLLLAAGRGWRLVRGPAALAPSGAVARGGAVAVAMLLVAAIVPELSRYAAERRLAEVTATLQGIVASGRVVPQARPQLETLAAIASATAAADPSDTRGLVAAGTAMLVAGDTTAAEEWYRAALARGERAEIDLNLARALALAGRQQHAEAALRRAVWVSPALIGTLPTGERPRLRSELAALEDRLRRGELDAPPALPDPTVPAS
jgi:O-antigen ligase